MNNAHRFLFSFVTTALSLLLIACSTASDTSGAADKDPNASSPTSPGAESSDNTGRDPTNDPPADDPAHPAVTCGAGKTGGAGDTTLELKFDGFDREAIVHVPPSHDGVKPIPIVLVIHPLLLTNKDMRKLANVERFSDDATHGFIAIYPNGIERSWNAGECCTKAKDMKLNDVGFIQYVIDQVDSKWCVDKSRIYSMGFSNGAFLSHRLACELANGLTAIVPVAGTLGIPEATCKPAHPTPVLAIHGTDDALAPYLGGHPKLPKGDIFGTFSSVAATDAFWATTNECGPPQATPYFTRGEASCVRHDGCKENATVGVCTITPGGHQWPGGKPLPAMGHATKDLDATETAIAFFREHGL